MERKMLNEMEIDPEEYKEKIQSLPLSNFEWIKKRKEGFAELFSEGSPNLKKLLLFLWENNIETIGCCAGHYNERRFDLNFPYIGFYAPDKFNSEEGVVEFVQHVQKHCERFRVVGRHLIQKDTNKGAISIHPMFTISPEKTEIFFAAILEAFKTTI